MLVVAYSGLSCAHPIFWGASEVARNYTFILAFLCDDAISDLYFLLLRRNSDFTLRRSESV